MIVLPGVPQGWVVEFSQDVATKDVYLYLRGEGKEFAEAWTLTRDYNEGVRRLREGWARLELQSGIKLNWGMVVVGGDEWLNTVPE